MNRNAESMGTYGAEWEARGYCGKGNVAELIGSLSGRSAIVAGNAAGVFEEVHAARAVLDDPVIFGVNDAGIYLPKLDHWVSLHKDHMAAWKALRWQRNTGGMEATKYHSCDPHPVLDYAWVHLTPQFAISGYYAMQIAWIMGCERIHLCGCPGDVKPRFFEARPREDQGDQFGYGGGSQGSDHGIREDLIQHMKRQPAFKAAVTSASGWTQEFFGGLTSWQHSQPLQERKLALSPR